MTPQGFHQGDRDELCVFSKALMPPTVLIRTDNANLTHEVRGLSEKS